MSFSNCGGRGGVMFFGVILVVCCFISDAAGAPRRSQGPSISLRHQAPLFQLHRPSGSSSLSSASSHAPRSFRAGSTVPMSGGYLTLGAYFCDVTIGTPEETFEVLVDTGSSNLIVPASTCKNCGSTATKTYNYKASGSASLVQCSSDQCKKCTVDDSPADTCVFGDPFCFSEEDESCGFGITYGGGSSAVEGFIVNDKVCLGPLCVYDSPVNAIVNSFDMQTDTQNASAYFGIVGLAYPMNACNPSCTEPIWDQIAEDFPVQNVFGMCLTPSNGGALDLGFIDPNKYSGTIQYVPVITERWYNVGLNDVKVGQYSLNLSQFIYTTTNDVIGAFIDSGTSIILLSPMAYQSLQNVFQTYYCHLPAVCGNTTFFSSNCIPKKTIGSRIKEFPDLHFIFDGAGASDVDIPTGPEAYLMDAGDQYCLGVQPVTGVGAVLGDVFMQSQYIVFDRENDQLGFAQVTQCV